MPDLFPCVQTVLYIAQTTSDHSALRVDLILGHRTYFRLWRLSPLWISTSGFQEPIRQDMCQYWEVNARSSSTGPTWDAFKATIRGSYISNIAKHWKTNPLGLIDLLGSS